MNPARALLFALLCLVGPVHARLGALGTPHFETVPGTESIANGIVTAIAQDSRGLIWMGTTEGLLSFDGYRLRHYRHDPGDPQSLSDNYVRTLLPRDDGQLWVATQSGGISVYEPWHDRFRRYRHDPEDPSSLAHDGPIALVEDRDGAVWVGFGIHGLDRFDPLNGEFQHHRHDPADPGSINHNTVRSLLLDARGDLWIGSGAGLNRRRAGSDRFESIASRADDPQSLAAQYVYSLYQAEDGRLWIGTQASGAAILDPQTLSLQWLPQGEQGLGHPWIDGFVEPSPGRIWVASFGGGIDVLSSADARLISRIRHDPAVPGSLALDRVVAPIKDRSGLVWIGTWGGGLQRYNPHNALALQTLRHSPGDPRGLSHATVLSVLDIDAQTFWVGTGGNGIDVFDRQRGRIDGFRADPQRAGALPDGTIRALARSGDGRIWVGTQQAGLLGFDPELQRFDAFSVGERDQRIRRLLAGSEGVLWIGTQRGLARLRAGSNLAEFIRGPEGMDFNDAVWSLAEDGAGDLWVGTPDQLLRLPRGSDELQRPASSTRIPSAVMDLWWDGEWMWSIGPDGLHRFRLGGAQNIEFQPWGRDLQRDDPSYGRQLLGDEQGRLWTPRYLIEPQAERIYPLGRVEGAEVGNVEMGARARSADGLLMFGGTRGLLLIDPAAFRSWRYTPPLLITGLEIDGRAQPLEQLAKGLVLQPEQGRISVGFAALDYAAPQQIAYAYRLQGLDTDWIETDAERRVASYNNLWPGDYRLQIRARGRDGEWSEETLELPIQVLPAWWQTPSFAVALVLLVALSGYALWFWRSARIRQRTQELQRLVEARTEELSQAKERAERALGELQGTQRQLVAAEKMASLGQLVAGVAHEINTPIGVAVTAASHLQEANRDCSRKLELGKLTRSDLGTWQATNEEATRLILGSLERANTLITSFKRVSVDQSSEHRRRFLLHEFLNEVRVSLEPSFRRTAHNLQIDCPEAIEVDTFPGALFQILTNLINNALLHAFAEGQAGSMQLVARQQGERLQLRFFDDGVGMSEATAARAFDPFFTTRRGSGGSGLGLHLVHNLTTQLLGGTVELRSAPGQGAEFIFDLPRSAPRRAEERLTG